MWITVPGVLTAGENKKQRISSNKNSMWILVPGVLTAGEDSSGEAVWRTLTAGQR